MAPKKKMPSLQAKMAANVGNMAEEFKSFHLMMQQMLDKMNNFEAWRTTTDSSLGSLLTKTTETAMRISQLERAPMPPPPPPPPPPPAGWIPGGVDPNAAPSPASSREQPSAHGAGGGSSDLFQGQALRQVLPRVCNMNPHPLFSLLISHMVPLLILHILARYLWGY